MALASLVSFQEQNQKQNLDNAFASLMLFEKQKLQYFARRHSLRTFFDTLKAKAVFQRGG